MNSITLQVNICPGDIAYAQQIIPRLVERYRNACCETLAIVDLCPPQSTQFLNSAKRFPPEEFAKKVAVLKQIVEQWQAEKLFDRVVYLMPESGLFRSLSQKYLQGIVSETHDCYGHALMSYFAGLDLPKTRYVLHFDADLIIHGSSDWLTEAVERLETMPNVIAVSPRISPPSSTTESTPSVCDHIEGGWLSTWASQWTESGWLSDWISTRCFLIDRERLSELGSLIPEYRQARRAAWIHQLARATGNWLGELGDLPQLQPDASIIMRIRNYFKRRIVPIYPTPPEVMLHQKLQTTQTSCLYLSREDAWYLHPTTKPEQFLSMLPSLIAHVDRNDIPAEQRHFAEIRLNVWQQYFLQAMSRPT